MITFVNEENNIINLGGFHMMIPTQITISEAEWEVMRVVWANETVTSREVIDTLENKMDWKQSTIKTLIGRLVEKEALKTEKEGRKFIYSANISEDETVRNFSEDILDRVCKKQNGKVIQQLVQEAALSQDDIEQLMNQLQNKLVNAPVEIACECAPGQCDCHKA